ncbi:MAG: putative 5-methyltetrahydropteroyltriglutamate-homocysteine methyltransferase, partial [Ilumatobacteraceae bacterium]|nr:putative 5-methyltetrahydropteroyltriglutamate-homocysteine methyltransferase [Ilumatobacteraceae bacterium]
MPPVALPLIPTTVIGSYPQPSWLIDHDRLVEKGVPRTSAADVWRIAPEDLDDALDA